MNDAPAHRIRLTSPEKTAELAAAFARLVRPGDVFLLSGQIGAGKTHFTRSLIQARLAYADRPVEDVPSPTFTLVQTYEVDGFEIWHSDLYRLTHPDEVEELGLFDAFDTAVCLIEWPERGKGILPEPDLEVHLETRGEGRSVVLRARSELGAGVLNELELIGPAS